MEIKKKFLLKYKRIRNSNHRITARKNLQYFIYLVSFIVKDSEKYNILLSNVHDPSYPQNVYCLRQQLIELN